MLRILLSLAKIIGYILSPVILFLYRFISRRPPQKPDFTGDIVLVTGAAQGLGKELALQFAVQGGVLVLWDINKSKLEETRAELVSLGHKVFAYVVDCSKREEIYKYAERVTEEVGSVSVLVNNAGVMYTNTILDLKDHDIDLSHNVNIMAHYWLMRSFLPWMVENNYGYVVSIASILSFGGFPDVSAYCSSKAAAFSLCESLKMELHQLKKDGVSVTAVCPWHIGNTGMFKGFQTSIHWLIPALNPTAVAKRVVRATFDRKFCLILPSVLRMLVILKFLLPSKAYLELSSIILGDRPTRNVIQD